MVCCSKPILELAEYSEPQSYFCTRERELSKINFLSKSTAYLGPTSLISTLLSGKFQLPEYPKVGFWKVRVEAQGQVNEKAIKVEKFYDPKFEVYVRMPTFILDTEKYIEAEVSAFYPYEKTVKGDIHLRWFAKKVDYTTPLYNDSILYRQEYSYYHNISNTYRSNLYNARDGIPVRNISLISQPSRYGYFDPYVVSNLYIHSKN